MPNCALLFALLVIHVRTLILCSCQLLSLSFHVNSDHFDCNVSQVNLWVRCQAAVALFAVVDDAVSTRCADVGVGNIVETDVDSS